MMSELGEIRGVIVTALPTLPGDKVDQVLERLLN